MATISRSSAQHSPGPWAILQPKRKNGGLKFHIMHTQGAGRIATVDGPSNEGREAEMAENARLIAAAPLLLKALRGLAATVEPILLTDYSTGMAIDVALAEARVAIEMATPPDTPV